MNNVKLVLFGVLVFCVAAYLSINTGKAPRQYKTFSKTMEANRNGAPAPSASVQSNQGGHICIGGICKNIQDATAEEIIMAEQEEKDTQLAEALQKAEEAEQRALEAEQRALAAEQRAQQLLDVN